MSSVAVIIVTYKSAQLTIEALASVAAERAVADFDIQAVVVDNASGDLPAIAQAVQRNQWTWVSCVLAPRNGGFAYGNNLGIAQALAERPDSYIYMLNPDAQVLPGAMVTLIRFLEAHPQVGIAGSSFQTLDGSDWPFAFRFPGMVSELESGLAFGPASRLLSRWTVPRHMTRTTQPVDWICGASMMVRPAVIAATGGLDENYFLYFEETDFCRRARLAGFPTWYVPDSRVMHIMGQTTDVSHLSNEPRRLPPYWFESRRRYFGVTYGPFRAALIDIVAVLANALGNFKRLIQRRSRTAVPHLIKDLVRHSVLWPKNREFPPVRSALRSSGVG